MDATDYFEIQNLIYEYAARLDQGDLDGVGRLFAHADVHLPGRSAPVSNNPKLLSELFRDFVRLYDGSPRTRHMMSNVQIRPSGPNRAMAHVYVMVFQQTAELPLQPIIGGDYVDRFEKVDNVWRFSERIIANDLYGDLSAHGKYTYAPGGA